MLPVVVVGQAHFAQTTISSGGRTYWQYGAWTVIDFFAGRLLPRPSYFAIGFCNGHYITWTIVPVQIHGEIYEWDPMTCATMDYYALVTDWPTLVKLRIHMRAPGGHNLQLY